MNSISHISASQVNLYESCPNSWLESKINGLDIDETTDYYANYGTLFHEIAENIAKYEYFDGEFAIKDYDKKFSKCGLPAKMTSEYYKQGVEAIKRKYDELTDMNIVGAEVEFKVDDLEGIYPMVGYIDLVYFDENNKLIVRDYKTSKPYTKSKLVKQWQPFFYSVACKKLYGEYPKAFEFDFVRFDKKRIVMIDDKYLKLQRIKLQSICKKMKKSVQPSKYNPFFCNNFCQNRSVCPLYLKKHGGI